MKAKRLVALLLALVMIVGLFAMTASAYTYRDSCGVCYDLYGSSTIYMKPPQYGSWIKTASGTRVEGCGLRSGAHQHFVAKRNVMEICSKHGLIYDYYEWDYDHCFG